MSNLSNILALADTVIMETVSKSTTLPENLKKPLASQ